MGEILNAQIGNSSKEPYDSSAYECRAVAHYLRSNCSRALPKPAAEQDKNLHIARINLRTECNILLKNNNFIPIKT